MSQPVKIDFVSDIACPWCAVGLRSLEEAMARIEGLQVELHFQPFELNPQMPAAGEDAVEHLTRKYGITAEQAAQNGEAIRARGASLGFEFRMDRRRHVYNTFDAHRLLHWAALEAPQRQGSLRLYVSGDPLRAQRLAAMILQDAQVEILHASMEEKEINRLEA